MLSENNSPHRSNTISSPSIKQHKTRKLHTSTMLFFFLFVFSVQSVQIPNRRILHQPLVPLNPSPPSPSEPPSPSPPTPKFPFSSTNTTTTTTTSSSPDSPFFPILPPPPSPSTLASFPANISSLNLPHSPSPTFHSHKTLFISFAAVSFASLIAALLLFFYCRRRKRKPLHDNNNKTLISDNSTNNNNAIAGGPPKLRTPSSTSSEFLYLGTLSNSRAGTANVSNNNNNPSPISRVDPRKMDSPELQPLPPLLGRNFREREVESVTEEEEEEEEFYSPRGSLGGSGSRRVFAVKDTESSSSTCSCSSSSQVSFSPGRSYSKSPEQHSLSPERILADSPPILSNAYNGNVRSPSFSLTSKESDLLSPSLSPMVVIPNPDSSSPNRVLIEKLDTSIQNFKDLVRNMTPSLALPSPAAKDSSSVSSASTSPERALIEKKQSFSASPSTDRGFDKSPEIPPPMMVAVWDYNKDSSLSSSASSSPKKDLDTSPVRISVTLENPILTPPPPLPPPPPKQRRHWEKPVSSVPEPSATMPPSMTFMTQNPTTNSPPSPPPPPPKQKRHCEKPVSSELELPAPTPPSMTFITQKPIMNSPLPPPPPPLPPPLTLPKQRQHWEKPVSSVSFAQKISEPPPLMPPSMPFMTQKPITNWIDSEAVEDAEEASKPKLKTLHWDKVRASSDREMVWDHLGSSSFELNVEMIETLFVVNTPNPKPKQTTPHSILPSPNQENRVLDPKKAQNIAILLRALNVTVEEVCEALLEGNADTLGTELLESLLKMAPTKEEERKLKEYKDDSPVKLCHAEKFLKAVLDIPFAFRRVHSMLYIANFDSEVEYLKKSFETLEAACEELRNCKMFLKLLEAVLKTGNRMNVGTNRGDAHAFKLDTLLKLVDIKGADGKTTLLHFVVQEIVRIEGARLSNADQTPSSTVNEDARCRKLGLQVISGLSSELTNVKKAATMDSEILRGDVSKLSKGLGDIGEVLRLNETMGSDEKFSESMNSFMRMADEEIIRIQAHESVALSLVKEITEYFHGNSAKEEAHPFRIFMVVRDFLTVVERVCKEVGMVNKRTLVGSAHKLPVPVNPMMQAVFPVPLNPMQRAFPGRPHYGSDDDETSSSP